MLTAAQIDALRMKSEKLLDPITEFLIDDIAKRVATAGQFTGTASYEAWKLQQMGVSQRKLKKEIAKRLGVSLKDAEKLLTQAAETGYNFDMSRFPTSQAIPLSANSSLQQILNATVALAREDLTNMTQTMGFVGPDGICRELTDAYTNACDFAFQKVSTGAQDYISAIRDATRNLADKGIRTIDYKNGTHISMEAAVRRNLMSGMGMMQEQISESNHDLLGCDGWEISAHAGSAPDHEPIQGKQYSDKAYKRLNDSLLRRIGTLNCGHAAFPIILGVNEPQYTEEELEQFRQQNEEGVTFDGRHYTVYEATQRQRKFERSIRVQKQRILVDEAVEDKDKLQTDQIRLVRLRQEYARFSKGVGLPMQHARMETAGFDWKKGKAAEKTAKIYQNIAKMAQVDNSVDWSQTVPRVVTKEEKKALIIYADERNIKIPSLNNFDGDPELLKAEIDALSKIRDDLPIGRKPILSIGRSVPDAEFGETSGEHITLNAKALRSRVITEQNISDEGIFASRKIEDIVVHEYGHVFATFKCNKGLEIARMAIYNISGVETTLDEAIRYLSKNVSPYAIKFPSKNSSPQYFDIKKYKEVIPEVLAKHNSTPDAFTSEFVRLLKELT